jgi:hypothetical protein
VGMHSVNRHNTWGKREGGVPVGLRKGGQSMWASIQRSERAQGAWMSMTSLQEAWGRNSKRAARTQPMCCREAAATHLDQDVFAWASTSSLSGASDCRNRARPTVLSLMKGDSISDRHSSGTCVRAAHASHRNHTHCDVRHRQGAPRRRRRDTSKPAPLCHPPPAMRLGTPCALVKLTE